MNRAFVVLLTLIIAVAGCRKEAERSGSEQTPPAPETHASAAVVPGSHEDWCGEHQVPETACTRCDPTLVPAFKATQDWCEEHGLPESQCLACNADLKIIRPPKSEGK